MKKIINILLFVLITCSLIAQERTVSKDFRRTGDTYYKYTGVAADTLISTNQDTIDYVFQVFQHNLVKKIDVKIRYDVVLGADTTVSAELAGKEFSDQTTYTAIIAASNSSAVSADNTVQIISSDYTESIAAFDVAKDAFNLTSAAYNIDADTSSAGNIDSLFVPSYTIAVPADTLEFPAQTVTPADKSFRFYRLRLIIAGDDATGTGIKVDEIEIKLYTD